MIIKFSNMVSFSVIKEGELKNITVMLNAYASMCLYVDKHRVRIERRLH